MVRVQTKGFDGVGTAPTLYQDTEYNALGQVARKSNMYKAGDSPVWSSYLYDALGRVTGESLTGTAGCLAGDPTTKFPYNALVSTTTDAKCQTKTTTKNAQGQVAQVTDALNNTVSYSYNALGQLLSTNAAGSITSMSYNHRGQKIAMLDPAMGHWVYAYNVFGELVYQRDSLNQSATMEYDKLGRLTKRTEPDLVSQWSYDKYVDNSACAKGIGKLCEATTTNGYSILGGAVIGTRQTDVLYDARGNISYKSDVGTYWYDAARPNRMTNVTLSAPAGADQSNFTGTRALSYAYDDYRNNAQLINGTTVGNGNLEYAVTHDAGTLPGGVLRHHVRWESYTSFNMPSEIKFGNLLAASGCAAGYQLIGTNCVLESIPLPATLATATYTCAPGSTVSGSNCVNGTNTTPATLTYGCQVEYVLMYAVSCVHPQLVGSASAAQASYTCVQGTLAGTSCIVDNVSTPASVSYSCGAGLTMAGGLCITTSALTTVSTALQTVADRTLAFVYGPEHQRIKQTVTLPGTGTSAYFAGSTWYLNGEDGQGLTYEREVRTNGTVEERYFVNAGGVVFAMYASRSGTLNGLSAAQVNYLHHDQLGSVAVVTDGAGTPAGKSDAVIDRLAYDPWGKRRNINANVGNPDVGDAIVGAMTERGYTMHEHLDEMGVIHMNGRVYDPLIGRFMSADPFIQSPDNLQSYNRYSYVLNNPLCYTDPSGYSHSGSRSGSEQLWQSE